jgi:hypothetical protein
LPGLFTHIGSITTTIDATTATEMTATVTLEPNFHYGAPDYLDADGTVVFCTIAVEDSDGGFVQSSSFTTNPPLATEFDIVTTTFDMGVPTTTIDDFTAIPGPLVICPPAVGGFTQFSFTQGGLTVGQKVKITVHGTLIPEDLGLQQYKSGSLFNFQPLLTERFHETVIEHQP